MAVTREMSIAYGGQAIPGSIAGAELTLEGIHRIQKTSETILVVFRFVVDALGSESVLAAAAVALEELFATERLALEVTLLGSASLTLDDLDGSAIGVKPAIEKVGEEDPRFDTNTSRLYEVTVEAGLPARSADDDWLRDFFYDVTYTPSRRGGLVVRGTYTVDPGPPLVDAEAVYLAAIDAKVEAIRSGLGWTIELVSERYTPNTTTTLVEFERVYREIVFNQSSNAIDDPSIVDPQMSVRVLDEGSSSDPNATPLRTVVAEYTAAVDVTLAPDLITVWEGTIFPWVVANMIIVADGNLAVNSVEPGYNFDEHTIQATVTGKAVAGSLLSRRVEVTDDIDFGKIIRYEWPDEVPEDEAATVPRPTKARVYKANRRITRTIITTSENLGELAAPAIGANVLGVPRIVLKDGAVNIDDLASAELPNGTAAILLSRRSVTRPRVEGLEGSQLQVTEREITEVFEIIVRSGAPGGDSTRTRTRTTRARGSREIIG